MRANSKIVQGDFQGGEIEPGTFHLKDPEGSVGGGNRAAASGKHTPPAGETASDAVSDGNPFARADTSAEPEVTDTQA